MIKWEDVTEEHEDQYRSFAIDFIENNGVCDRLPTFEEWLIEKATSHLPDSKADKL